MVALNGDPSLRFGSLLDYHGELIEVRYNVWAPADVAWVIVFDGKGGHTVLDELYLGAPGEPTLRSGVIVHPGVQ